VVGDRRGLQFGSVAEQYDAYRPSPPDVALELLGDGAGTKILEVGAGTGLWTRFLVEHGFSVTAVEPDVDMIAILQRRSPTVRALPGSAEALPVEDDSFDAALVSSAWHWFRQPDATTEIARVVRDGGLLFVLWNGFSRDVPWVESLTELRESPNDEHRQPRGWSADFSNESPFTVVREVECNWIWPRTIDQVIALFGTYSGSIVRGDGARRAMEEKLRSRLVGHVHSGVVDVAMTIRGTIGRRKNRN